jgi:hypothetical protein
MDATGQLHAPAALSRREGARGTHRIGGWVGPRVVLEAVVKRKIPRPGIEPLNPYRPTSSPAVYRLRYHGSENGKGGRRK